MVEILEAVLANLNRTTVHGKENCKLLYSSMETLEQLRDALRQAKEQATEEGDDHGCNQAEVHN